MAVCMWISKAPASMSVSLLPNNVNNSRPPLRLRPVPASLHIGVEAVKEANPADLSFQEAKERISKLFDKVELSVSAYDTAWVALVPSPNHQKAPCFPECLKWLMENQLDDGSWGLPHHHPLLVKDALSSTLACTLALKRWGVGEERINKGLRFIELNSASATDVNQHSPIGFDIIFPGMLEYAKDLNLRLPIKTTDFDSMLHNKELELRRCQSQESEASLAYVSEGFGNLHDWSKVMKYQMKNGSLFNSPATTAAAFTCNQNGACLNYLRSLLEKFGNAVPTVYPHDLHLRLSMIDNLERLGIDWHFRVEIQNVLDDTYRCWLQGDEQIFMDVATCAMAFRMLRTNGYDISSDLLANISQGGCWNSLGENFGDVRAALEVYKSSEIIIYEDEITLREQNITSRNFLRQKLSNSLLASKRFTSYIDLEVNNTLKYPFNADLQRMYNRRNIEHYNVYGTRIMKTSYCSVNISNNDFLKLAVEDFNSCQSIYRTELECLERWVVENRLDKLKFARQKTAYCYFSAAATLLSPELSDARNSWAKNGILTTVIDDFFDVGGSMEELVNLIELMEKWNVNVDTDCCSEQVRTIFLALQNAIHELEDKAFKWQARSVKSHIIETWLKLMNSMLREAEWDRNNRVPTLDEYMENGYVSFALGPIILPALYFVGPKLSEEIVRSSEYDKLYELVSTVGRLLNDVQTLKREQQEGKMNAVPLYMIHCNGCIGEEDAVKQIKILISIREKELLRLVLKESSSVVPRACKNLFWNMCKVLNLFYAADDGFTSNDISSTVKAIIHQPISISLDSVPIN